MRKDLKTTNAVRRLLWRKRFRGKARLLLSMCPVEGEYQIDLFGSRITLDLEDYIQRCMYLNVFEPEETSFVQAYLKPGMCFVDAGANIGYYSLLAAEKVGLKGLVMAFEPSPYAYERLVRTVTENGLRQVRAEQAGLGEQNGVARLQLPVEKGNHTPTMVGIGDTNVITTPVYRLDEYLERRGIAKVDLLKLDVEGYEPNIILGADRYLKAGRISALLCEFHRPWLEANHWTPERMHALICDYGFDLLSRPPDWKKDLQYLVYQKSEN